MTNDSFIDNEAYWVNPKGKKIMELMLKKKGKLSLELSLVNMTTAGFVITRFSFEPLSKYFEMQLEKL